MCYRGPDGHCQGHFCKYIDFFFKIKSLGSRRARACSDGGFSSKNGDRPSCTTEEQPSIVRFIWAKGLSAKDIHKCFQLTVGSVYRIKHFTKRGKRFADGEEVETEVRKWLRQQLGDFYASGGVRGSVVG
jgi:hypothetical protein